MKLFGVVAIGAFLLSLSSIQPVRAAQANLENPTLVSFQSGIGVVSGWACDAERIDIVFDNIATLQAAYGTDRADTSSVCGDTDNGFGLLVNWNLLGDGTHTVRALADGVEIGSATVVVHTFAPEFLIGGKTDICRIPHVPVQDQDTFVQWQQSLQNFVIVDIQPHQSQFQGPECDD
ncbi:MAG: hypothetical protein AB7P69_18820 [Candidatus Binatia bacterium]